LSIAIWYGVSHNCEIYEICFNIGKIFLFRYCDYAQSLATRTRTHQASQI
jgi:hypothetical protein